MKICQYPVLLPTFYFESFWYLDDVRVFIYFNFIIKEKEWIPYYFESFWYLDVVRVFIYLNFIIKEKELIPYYFEYF